MATILKAPRPVADGPVQTPGRFRRTKRAGAWLTIGFVSIAILIIISPGFYLPASIPRAGTMWKSPDVISPFSYSVIDTEMAEQQRNLVEQRHHKIFLLDTRVEAGSRKKLQELLQDARVAMEKGETTPSLLSEKVQRELGIDISNRTAEVLLQNAKSSRFETDLSALLHHFYSARALTTDKHLFYGAFRNNRIEIVAQPKSDFASTPTLETVFDFPGETFAYLDRVYLANFDVSADVRQAYSEIAKQLLRPNLSYDEDMTRTRKQVALQQAVPYVLVRPGDLIISQGERLSRVQVIMLEKLYTKLRQYNLLKSFGDAVFVVLCVLFVLLYARKYNPHLAFNASNVTMVALPIIFALSLARIVLNLGDDTLLSAYAFPAGMVGMLGIILFDAQFALVLVTLSSLLFGVAAEMNFVYILVSIVGGFTAVASLYTIKERKEVLIAGLRLALINFVAVLASGLVMHPEKLDLAAAIGGLVNGFVCYILTLGALPLFEVLFKVATEVRLIELTSTNHPLLRMMEQKAPGSFQHALNVASLAEPAAEAIGANYLLVRAGSYFHDIGKALKPKYYTENQVTPEERRTHSKLSPYMSNLIIKNHVKDGIDLGRKYRLPEKVVDFIAQHQGTGLIKYFYNEALERAEPNDVVHEEEFRYPGPKPQSIEVAIVMLADTVEATATAIFANKTINEDDLRRLVRDAILDKFHDGQFDECHMTFRDLHQISESFVQTLRSRYHHRIEYPTSTPGRREVKDITRTLPPDKAASAIARQA